MSKFLKKSLEQITLIQAVTQVAECLHWKQCQRKGCHCHIDPSGNHGARRGLGSNQGNVGQ